MNTERSQDKEEPSVPEIIYGLPADIDDRMLERVLVEFVKDREYIPGLYGIGLNPKDYLENSHSIGIFKDEVEKIKNGETALFPFTSHLIDRPDFEFRGVLLSGKRDMPTENDETEEVITFSINLALDEVPPVAKEKVDRAQEDYKRRFDEYLVQLGVAKAYEA